MIIDWIDIPNTKYQVNCLGGIRRVLNSGYRDLKPFLSRGYKCVNINLTGKIKKVRLHLLIAKAFDIKLNPDEVLYFINGLKSDCVLNNIGTIKRSKLSRETAFLEKYMEVAKIDREGNIVEVYKSARECARKNFMNNKTVSNRCNGKIKSTYGLDGFKYMWDKNINY